MLKLALFLLATSAFAAPITFGPVGLTGSGFWNWSPQGSGTQLFASGTDGVHTVSLNVSVASAQQFGPAVYLGGDFRPNNFGGSVTIDGFTGAASYSFQLNPGGPSWVKTFDATGALLAQADLIFFLRPNSTNPVYRPDGQLAQSSGTFSVVSVPEPSTWLLSFAGLSAIAWRATRRRAKL